MIKKRKIAKNVKAAHKAWLRAQELADLYANGNLSAWVRYAMVKCPPPEKKN